MAEIGGDRYVGECIQAGLVRWIAFEEFWKLSTHRYTICQSQSLDFPVMKITSSEHARWTDS